MKVTVRSGSCEPSELKGLTSRDQYERTGGTFQLLWTPTYVSTGVTTLTTSSASRITAPPTPAKNAAGTIVQGEHPHA